MRRITGPVSQGIHRVAWDLRYPPVDPTELEVRVPRRVGGGPAGPAGRAGDLHRVAWRSAWAACITPLGAPQTFTVESLRLATLPEKDRQALLAFQQQAGALQRAMMGASNAADEALRNIRFMKKALADTPKADPAMAADSCVRSSRSCAPQ